MLLIDEIIQVIKEEAGNSEYLFLDPKVKNAFFSRKKSLSSDKISKSNEPTKKPHLEKGDMEVVRQKESVLEKNLVDCSNMNFEQLHHQVKNCKNCRLCTSRTNIVFGEGNTKAELMLIGEGPGRDEDEQGRPFVGKSGQLLTKMLNAMGFQREEVYIANIVKCRPPNNRNPMPDEAEVCKRFLLRQIELIKPKVIILLGAVPLKFMLNKTGITKLHGEWFDFKGIKTLATFHPAFLLRDPRQKKYAWDDLQKAMTVLKKI